MVSWMINCLCRCGMRYWQAWFFSVVPVLSEVSCTWKFLNWFNWNRALVQSSPCALLFCSTSFSIDLNPGHSNGLDQKRRARTSSCAPLPGGAERWFMPWPPCVEMLGQAGEEGVIRALGSAEDTMKAISWWMKVGLKGNRGGRGNLLAS